jgi:phosphoglycerate-specific signal transduction histidine kinase
MRLSKLLKESKYNRIYTDKIKVTIEKVAASLPESKQNKLNALFTDLLECVFCINSTPYGLFSIHPVESKLTELDGKIKELREFLEKECNKDSDPKSLVHVALKELNEIFEY